MARILFVLLLGVASTVSAQVRVEWLPEKQVFLEGEPIYVVLKITNVGSTPLGYQQGEGWLQPFFSVDGRERYAWRRGCDGPRTAVIAGGGWVTHPPTFAPGESIAFRYLVRGYRLEPGSHVIQSDAFPPVSGHSNRRVSNFTVVVAPADASALQDVFAALVKLGTNNATSEGRLARAGIFEAAPRDLLAVIAKFASDDKAYWNIHFPVSAAYEALADVNSVEARAHLRRLYDETPDLNSRAAVVDALSRISHPDSLDFLTSLLPGRHTPGDDRIKRSAVNGLVCIGSPAAAAAIVQGTRNWMERDRRIDILMKVSPRDAVDELVQIDAGADFGVMLSTCRKLESVTHYRWCDDGLISSVFTWPSDEQLVRPVFDKIRSRWRTWWPRNRSIRMYDPANPPADSSLLPKIW